MINFQLIASLCFHRRRQWQPTPVLLPGNSHGRRSLVGCSPWGRKESDTTERLHFHFSLSCTGEGNGNPLQRCCLENPKDGDSLVGCRLRGRTESDTTEATQQQQQLCFHRHLEEEKTIDEWYVKCFRRGIVCQRGERGREKLTNQRQCRMHIQVYRADHPNL